MTAFYQSIIRSSVESLSPYWIPVDFLDPATIVGAEGIYGVTSHGTDLYIFGDISSAQGVPTVSKILKWNGSDWSDPCPEPLVGTPNNVYISPSGEIYVSNVTKSDGLGGYIYHRVAKWNGSTWVAGIDTDQPLDSGESDFKRILFSFQGRTFSHGIYDRNISLNFNKSAFSELTTRLVPIPDANSISGKSIVGYPSACIHNNEIYVFTAANIFIYDGSNCRLADGNSRCGIGGPSAAACTSYNGYIYVLGAFQDAVPASDSGGGYTLTGLKGAMRWNGTGLEAVPYMSKVSSSSFLCGHTVGNKLLAYTKDPSTTVDGKMSPYLIYFDSDGPHALPNDLKLLLQSYSIYSVPTGITTYSNKIVAICHKANYGGIYRPYNRRGEFCGGLVTPSNNSILQTWI